MKINVFLFFKNMKTSLFRSSEIRFEAVVTLLLLLLKKKHYIFSKQRGINFTLREAMLFEGESRCRYHLLRAREYQQLIFSLLKVVHTFIRIFLIFLLTFCTILHHHGEMMRNAMTQGSSLIQLY